jgi:Phosphotransferase enzyme family
MKECAPLEDPVLPALASGRHDMLAAALARVGLRGGYTVALLKHHPGLRCTLAIAAGTDRYVVKLFADAATVLALSAVHQVLAGVGLASGRGPSVPRLVGVDTDAALLVTEMYSACPATELIERGEPDRAGWLAAQWLRAAATLRVTLGDPYDPPHALEDVDRYVYTIGSAAGELGGRAGAVRDRLAADMPPPGHSDLRHGGFYLSHVFDLGDGPGVIDWDTFRQGPVEVDAGMLCAMAARWAVHRPDHAGAAQRAVGVFLDEVDDLVDPARLRWYWAAALLKFTSYLARRRPDGWVLSAASLISDAEMVSV